MKKFQYVLCSIVLFFFLSNLLNAQVTITYSDLQTATTFGKTIVNHEDTTTKSLDIGATGATSWDFSSVKNHNQFLATYTNPATAPNSALFPNANLCQHLVQPSGGVSYDFYLFVQIATSGFNFHGMYMEGVIQPGMTQSILLTRTNAENSIQTPLTLNTAWTTTFSDTMKSFVNGMTLNTSYANNSISSVVDAYGTVKFPGGATYQALRIKRDARKTIKYSPAGEIFYSRKISYSIVTRDGVSFEITAKDTTTANSGVIQLGSNISWSTTGAMDIKSDDFSSVKDFELLQNYPNPFNPSTTFTFKLQKEGNVSLKVYDCMGKEISNLVESFKNAGVHSVKYDAGNLTSGAYFCVLTQNEKREIKKIILLK